MADTSSAAIAASVPSVQDRSRVEDFTREPFLHDGETVEDALPPGTPRRRAFDAALAELERGEERPSLEWRRQYSLLLGLERLLFEDEPHLAGGTLLSAHQVDALAGTLTALSADIMRNGNGNGTGNGAVGPDTGELAAVGIPGEEEDEEDEPEEPVDWRENGVDADVADQPEDPGANKRFWFEHATAATSSTSSTASFATVATRTASRRRCSAPRTPLMDRSPWRRTSGSCATPARSRTPTRSSSATRPTRRWARRPRPPSATGWGPSSSA